MVHRNIFHPRVVPKRLALALTATLAAAAFTASIVLAQSGAPYAISRSTFPGGAGRVSSGGPIVIDGSIGEVTYASASGGTFAVRGGTFGESGPTIRGRVPMTASDGPQR